MVTSPPIDFYEQAIFEDRRQSLLFLVLKWSFCNFEKYIGAGTMDQKESTIHTEKK